MEIENGAIQEINFQHPSFTAYTHTHTNTNNLKKGIFIESEWPVFARH